MTPTPEEIDAAKKWVLENIDNAYGFEGTAEHVWLSDWLAEYAAHCTTEKDRQIKMLELKTSNSLANNLCPDHRDKQVGKSCLACTIEQKDAEIVRLKDVLSAARQYIIYVESFASCGFKSLKDVIDAYDRATLQETNP